MSNAKDEIKRHVDDFVTVLSTLVRRAAVEEVTAAIESAAAQRPMRPAQITKTRGLRKVVSPTPGPKGAAPLAASRPGQQRTPELLVQLMGRVHGHIEANPGQGVGPIAASLGTSTKELSLLLRKLLDDKKVISKGKKRGTRYFPR